MREYKYVAVDSHVVIPKSDKTEETINNYFDVIAQEEVDGWVFVCVAPVHAIIKKKKKGESMLNTFIFAREKAE